MSPDPKAPQYENDPTRTGEEEIEDLEAPAQAQSDVEGGCWFASGNSCTTTESLQ